MISIPKRNGIESFIGVLGNTDANANNMVVGTGNSFPASWAQIDASVDNAFYIIGISASLVWSSGAASTSGGLPFLLEIGTGAMSSEVPVGRFPMGALGVQYTHADGAVAQIGAGSYVSCPQILIPAGVRLAQRAVTTGSFNAVNSFYIHTLSVATGQIGGIPVDFDLYQRGVYKARIFASDFADISTHATTNWTSYGTTVEHIASASRPLLVRGINSGIVDAISTGTHAAIEIGVGGSGSEVWHSLVPLPGRLALPGPSGGFRETRRALYVNAGQRVALRAKGNSGKTFPASIVYEEWGV